MSGNPIIVCDFDGTITRQDFGVATMERFAVGDWWTIEQRWRNREIGSRECLQLQFDLVRATQSELEAFYEAAPVDESFATFAAECRTHGIPLVILSDGLDFYIRIVLNRLGLVELPFYANHLAFRGDRLVVEFPNAPGGCGMCANCKATHLQRIRAEHSPVVFVGDGHSDRCAVYNADRLYAKGFLLEYCREHGVECSPLGTFADLKGLPSELAAHAAGA